MTKLCESAHLVTSNFRVGVSARLGIDPETLQREFPGLAVMESPAYGISGPRVLEAGVDMVMQALCGHEVRLGGAGNPPQWARTVMVDYCSGMLGSIGALLCLYHQTRTGQEIRMYLPLVNGALYLISELIQTPGGVFCGAPPLNSQQTGIHPAEAFYRARDGWIAISARGDDAAMRLLRALGLTAAIMRPLKDWGPAEYDQICSAVALLSRADALELLEDSGVWAESWNSEPETARLRDPVLAELGIMHRYVHPEWGPMGQIGSLVRFSRSTKREPRHSPLSGEHTREILSELGYDEATIAEFYAESVVA